MGLFDRFRPAPKDAPRIPRAIAIQLNKNNDRLRWLNRADNTRDREETDTMMYAQFKRNRRAAKCASDFAAMRAGQANWRAMESRRANGGV